MSQDSRSRLEKFLTQDGPHEVTRSILLFLGPRDGARFLQTNKTLHQWVVLSMPQLVKWWRDLKLYEMVTVKQSLLEKIMETTVHGRFRFVSDEIDFDDNSMISFENVIQLYLTKVQGRLREYALHLPPFMDPCSSCGQLFVPILSSFNPVLCVACRVSGILASNPLQGLRLALRMPYLTENNESRYPNRITLEEACYVPDFMYPDSIELHRSEYSVCIVCEMEGGEENIWFVGDGLRDPNVKYC